MIQQQIRNISNSEERLKTIMHSFRIDNTTELLYIDEPDGYVRLCIPEKAYQIALSNYHNNWAHAGIT